MADNIFERINLQNMCILMLISIRIFNTKIFGMNRKERFADPKPRIDK